MEGLSHINKSTFHHKIKSFFESQSKKDYFSAKGYRDSLAEILNDIKEINSNFSMIDQKTKFSEEEFSDLVELYQGYIKIIEENEGFLKQFAEEEVEKVYSHANNIEKTLKQKDLKTGRLLLETNSISYGVLKGQLIRLGKVFNTKLIEKLQVKLETMPVPILKVVDIAGKAKPVIAKEIQQEDVLTEDNIETAKNLIDSILQLSIDSGKYIEAGELNYIFTECKKLSENIGEDAWFPAKHRKQLQQVSEHLTPKISALREAIEIALEVLPTEFPQLSKYNRIAYFMQVMARVEKNLEKKGMISIQDIYELEILKYELKWILKNLLDHTNSVKSSEFINWFKLNEINPLFITINTANAGKRDCIPMFPIEAMCWKEEGEIFWEEMHLGKLIFYKMIPTESDVKIFEFSYDTIDWVPCYNYEVRGGPKDIVIMDDKHYSVKHVNAKEKVARMMLEINQDVKELLSILPDYRKFPKEIDAEHLPQLCQDRAHIEYNNANRSKFREGNEQYLDLVYKGSNWPLIVKKLEEVMSKLEEIMPFNEISATAKRSRFFDIIVIVDGIVSNKNCTVVDLAKLATQRGYLEGFISLLTRTGGKIPDFIYWGWLRNEKDVTDYIEEDYREGCIPFLIDSKDYRTCQYAMKEEDNVFECSWSDIRDGVAIDMRGFLNTEFGFWEIQAKIAGEWRIVDNEQWPFVGMIEKPPIPKDILIEEPKKQIGYKDLNKGFIELLDLYPDPRKYPLKKEKLKALEKELLGDYRKAVAEIKINFHDLPEMRDQGIKQQRELILRADPYRKDLDQFYSDIKNKEIMIIKAIENLEKDLRVIYGKPLPELNKLRELAELFPKMNEYGNFSILGLSKMFDLIYRVEELLKLINTDPENLPQILELWLPVKPVNAVVVKTRTEGYKSCTPLTINKKEELVWFVGEKGDTIRYEVFNKYHDLIGVATAKVSYNKENDEYRIVPFTDKVEKRFIKFEG